VIEEKTMEVSNDKLKEIYVLMKRCRAFEERAAGEFRKGNLPGSIHLSVGQEAVSSGVCSMLEKDDYILTSHRPHSDIISKSYKFDKLMAELFARETGCCRGKGGSMHIVIPECNVLGATGIVGSGIPIATGAGLALKMKHSKSVVVCFFGDGATFTGAFHEGIGLAVAFEAPVIFVCHNNQYAVSTSWKDFCKLDSLADRARGYGIPGISVDGMDARAVAEAAGDAIKRARDGGGPTLIEANTYRYYGHNMADQGTAYRKKQEVEEWRKKDPIHRLYTFLVSETLMTEKENQELDAKISQELDAVAEASKNSREPREEEALEHVYCEKG
jgi:acetoin:2,6-dichlorophenolindophenol oxidoreductase subunit alpha